MITKCGDNCTYCPRYLATQDGREIELEKAKELWTRLGLKGHDLSVENMACHGCKPQNDCAYPELRACVTAKAYDNCGLCDEYPCILTKSVFDKSGKLEAHAKQVCAHWEMELLRKAFFSKKENLDRIHRERHGSGV